MLRSLVRPAERFCAGHFTIFSRKTRERIHGHDYEVEILSNWLTPAASAAAATAVRSAVAPWRGRLLLPAHCPFLDVSIDHVSGMATVVHDGGIIYELRASLVALVPLANVTGEELSAHFLSLVRDAVGKVHAQTPLSQQSAPI